jgi:hypothetical protein
MMRISWFARVGAWALVCVASCGGSGFSAGGGDAGGDGGDDGGSADGSVQDGASDGGEGGTTGVTCGPQTTCSGITPVCCLGGTGPACAHVQCGCETQIECASDRDCQAPMGACCIDKRTDATCPNSDHFVARCALACVNGASHLCDPNAQVSQCLAGTCSTNASDLQNVGLPAGPEYGVCK